MSANSLSAELSSSSSSRDRSSSEHSSSDRYVHELVELQAKATPDAIALTCGNQRLSYRELNARANALAHRLRALGIGPHVAVGLCAERSAELLIGALAILKASGAYVPLDPSYPPQRLSMLLEDSGAPLVVTQSALASKPPSGKWRTIVLGDDDLDHANDSIPSSVNTVKPDNPAYIIFTSGSTGRPKGVKISHGNLLNLIQWHQRAFKVTKEDRATLLASPGFDASVWEMWPYLATGASLYVVDETVRATPNALRDWIVGSGITISFLPTVLAESLIALPWPPKTALRLLLTGADRLRRRPPQNLPFDLINNYGPTECTVVATSGKISSDDQSTELPSIGKPIDNVAVYIVDEHLQPVPRGTTGELLIGGRGVGQGYVNAPDQTAQSFLPDSFSGEPGARLYRTGDLARLLPNGEIAYLGRLDDQVKVMGYRVEPNEIVTVLNLHPQIETSFVCSCPDASGNQRLVAYIVPTSDQSPRPDDLRNFLSTQLPSHMVPSAFVRLARLPLSAHGKLDRAALPQPTRENMLREDSRDTPQSPIEEHLAGLLSRLLALPSVSREDNFFTLGGHSLMGAQLIAKIRESFGVELTLRNLFEEPTVRGMSAEIERLIHARLAIMSDDEARRLLTSSEGL
jgi:amino acid adenylation domain-containing protein